MHFKKTWSALATSRYYVRYSSPNWGTGSRSEVLRVNLVKFINLCRLVVIWEEALSLCPYNLHVTSTYKWWYRHANLYLSWTFCLMSANMSDVISRSRYSDNCSVACSKSFWLSWQASASNNANVDVEIICREPRNLELKARQRHHPLQSVIVSRRLSK